MHSFLLLALAQYFCTSARHAPEPPCSCAVASSGSKAASAETISRWPPMGRSLFGRYARVAEVVRIAVMGIADVGIVVVRSVPLVAQLALVAVQPMLVVAQGRVVGVALGVVGAELLPVRAD